MKPKVRFKGFSGEWKETSFRDITVKTTEKNKDDLPLESFSISNTSGFIPQNQQFENGGTMADADKRMYYIVSPYTFAYNPARINVGSIGYYEGANDVIVSSLYEVFKTTNGINDKFLTLWFKSPTFHKMIDLYQEGGVRLYFFFDKLLKCSIDLPSLPEQTTIATFFTHLDTLISSTSRRLEKLRAVKTAALQTLFPQEGEKEPRVRFKGFSGEWKEVKLGECLEICNERNSDCNYGHNQVLSVSEEAGVVNQIDLLGRSYAGKSVANYKILRPGQIVYTKSPLKAKPYGIVKVNKEETGIVSVLYAVYNAKENISADYIHYYFAPAFRLNNYLSPLVEKGAKNTMNISDSTALDGLVFIPPTLPEQTAIANYFTHLDTLIASTSRRLDKLRAVKSACLEGMFV